MNNCIDNDQYEPHLYYFMAIVCLMALMTLNYIRRIIQFQTLNPISELSPILTIIQAVCLYFFFTLILAFLYIHLTSDIISDHENFWILLMGRVQNFVRGLFIVTTLVKSIRITVAFRLTLRKHPYMEEIFKDQTILAVLSLFVALSFWTLPYVLVTFHDSMQNYEKFNWIAAMNNLTEVLSALYIIYINVSHIYEFDAVKQYIQIPLIIYSAWLFCNSFISYFIEGSGSGISECLQIEMIIMFVSQMLRSIVLFYFIIIKPLMNCQQARPSFTPSLILDEFDLFIRIPFCVESFYNYLKHHDDLFDTMDSNEFSNSTQLFEYYLDLLMNDEQDSVVQKEIRTKLYSQDCLTQLEIQAKLFNYMNSIYTQYYKSTIAFQKLKHLFRKLDKANQNFFRLKLISKYCI